MTPRPPALNDRQRAYLLAIFETDQETEAAMRSIPYRPFEQRPKASEWRWLEYSEGVPEGGRPPTALYMRIKKLDLVDQGTGSTFSALADRGLIEVNWHGRNVWGQLKPHIRLTPAGRRLGRSWTGAKAYKAPPAGTLKEWHWRALAKAYAVGDQGVEGSGGDWGGIGWPTWLRLLNYKWGALIAERPNPTPLRDGDRYRVHITGAGQALYERERARYRELYPDVEAPEPAALEVVNDTARDLR